MNTESLESALRNQDISVFAPIEAQLTDSDKRSLLAIQWALRTMYTGYTYLEIGSHLGGSLQPHVLDPHCSRIISIDARPAAVADDRVDAVPYPANSTGQMLQLLRNVAGERVEKITTIDADAAAVDLTTLPSLPHLCFIDGEHTERAALSDYTFCHRILRKDGVIAFHDGNIVFPALDKIVTDLKRKGENIRSYVLPSTVFVIEFGDANIHKCDAIRELLLNNGEAYLYGLMSLLHYRDVYSSRYMQILRNLWHFVHPRGHPWRSPQQ
jgi:hypothetical protein